MPMPIFKLVCPKCGLKLAKILQRTPEESALCCLNCGDVVLVRDGGGPSSRVVEVRDNGVMPKKVEQLANIDELIKNR